MDVGIATRQFRARMQQFCVKFVSHGSMLHANMCRMKAYEFLKENEAVDWYCDECNRGVAKMLHTMTEKLEGDFVAMKQAKKLLSVQGALTKILLSVRSELLCSIINISGR